MASAATDDRRSSAPLNLSSDVLSILRRSSAIFSSAVTGPLLLIVASLLLFLFRSLILYLGFRCTASRMKHRDDPNYSIAIMIYYQLVAILILAFAFLGYFILYSALHLTALLAVLSSLLNKPPPTAGSFIATFRHGCRFGNRRLLVFHKTALLSKHIQQACAVFLLISLTGGDALLRSSLRKMAPGPSPFHLLDDMEDQFPVLIAAWTALEMAATVVVINLAPWVLLFLDPAADERRIGVWYAVKRGCFLMSLMFFQAMTVKIMEYVVCGELRRKDLMTIMAAGDWRGLFVVLVVKSVAEAFFVVVWLVFYVAARRKAAAEIGGEAFDMQDLSNCLARLR